MTKTVGHDGVQYETGVETPLEHDLTKESREEYWRKECEKHPEIAECLIYED